MDQLRPGAVLSGCVHAGVGVRLVREEVARDLRIAAAGDLTLECRVGELPRATGVVVIADPDEASRPWRERVGCRSRAHVDQVPAVRRCRRRVGVRVVDVAITRRFRGTRRRSSSVGRVRARDPIVDFGSDCDGPPARTEPANDDGCRDPEAAFHFVLSPRLGSPVLSSAERARLRPATPNCDATRWSTDGSTRQSRAPAGTSSSRIA